jgi:hypothetical protein
MYMYTMGVHQTKHEQTLRGKYTIMANSVYGYVCSGTCNKQIYVFMKGTDVIRLRDAVL